MHTAFATARLCRGVCAHVGPASVLWLTPPPPAAARAPACAARARRCFRAV